MYKIYIFLFLLLFLLYELGKYVFRNNSLRENNCNQNKFINKTIDEHAYFLNEKDKQIIIKDMNKNGFFNTIDSIFLGKELLDYEKHISIYYLLGKSFMTSYLKTTPNCLRIVNKSHEKSILGYIYVENYDYKMKDYDKLKIILSGVLFHNMYSKKKLLFPKEDILFLKKNNNKYDIHLLSHSIYNILFLHKKKLKKCCYILKENKNILYKSLPIF